MCEVEDVRLVDGKLELLGLKLLMIHKQLHDDVDFWACLCNSKCNDSQHTHFKILIIVYISPQIYHMK